MPAFTQAGVEMIVAGMSKFDRDIQHATKLITGMDEKLDRLEGTSKKTGKQMQRTGQDFQKVALGATAAGAAMVAVATKVTLTAARAQELSIVLDNVGKNIGKSADEMARYEEGVKSMGITTTASRQALIQMVQANIDLSASTDLARLAQDAAVIGMLDSSEAFERLITGVQRGSIVMLRQLGIQANFQGSYKKMADSLGKTTLELTQAEKQQARLTEVLAQGKNIAGTYEAAMGSAGKQMRSMARHVEEIQIEMGNYLLPVMGQIVGATTDMLKGFRELPGPVKGTAIQMTAASGAILAVAGSAALAIPKITAMATALRSLAVVQAVGGLGPVAGVGLAVAGIATLITYMSNLEKARQDEAASILDASESYGHYITLLKNAGLESYKLSEHLWEVAKAGKEAGEGVDAAALGLAKAEIESLAAGVESTTQTFGLWTDGTEEVADATQQLITQISGQLPQLSDMALLVAQDTEQMRAFGLEMGLTTTEANRFATAMVESAEAVEFDRKVTAAHAAETSRNVGAVRDYREITRLSTKDVRALGEETGILTNELGFYIQKAEDAAAITEAQTIAQEALAEAIEDTVDAYLGFNTTLARGLIDIRDIQDDAAESAADYKEELDGLESKLAGLGGGGPDPIGRIMPDASTFAERLARTEPVWDEWVHRINDIQQNGVYEPWITMLNDLGYAKPSDVGMTEWLDNLKEGIQSGELTDLIFMDTTEWQESTRVMEESAGKAEEAWNKRVAADRAGVQEEIALLEQAREEELRIQQERANDAKVELALQILDASGQLDAWAQEEFAIPGLDMSSLDVSAADVALWFESGFKKIDDDMATMLDNVIGGLDELEASTAETAQANQEQLSSIAEGDWVSEMQGLLEELARFEALGEFDLAAGIQEEIDALKETEPFAPLTEGLETAQETIAQGFTDTLTGVQDELVTTNSVNEGVVKDMDDAWQGFADDLASVMYGESVLPEIQTQLQNVGDKATDVAEAAQKKFETFAQKSESAIKNMANSAVRELNRIKNAVLAIPTYITVNIVIETVENPWVTTLTAVKHIDEALHDLPEEIGINIPITTGGAPTAGIVGGFGGDYQEGDEYMFRIPPDIAKQYERLGRNLGQSFLDLVYKEQDERAARSNVAQTLLGVSGFFVDRYTTEILDPLEEQLDAINDILDDDEESRLDILKQTKKDLDALDKFLAEQSNLALLTEAEYNELLERRENYQRDLNGLAEERNELEQEYLEQQQRVGEYEDLQEKLDLLNEQAALFDLLRDFGIEDQAGELLAGLTVGLDAESEEWIDAMNAALERVIQAINSTLQIHSPSAVMAEVGQMMMLGLAQGVESFASVPAAAAATVVAAPAVMAQGDTNLNVNFGNTTINTPMDQVAFEERVVGAVRKAIRYGDR